MERTAVPGGSFCFFCFSQSNRKWLWRVSAFDGRAHPGISERRKKYAQEVLWMTVNGRGKVKSFDEDKGFGYIEGDNGEMFFVEKININMDLEVLQPGMLVNFTIVQGNPERERIATNVTMDF
jgi:CspA family cold shock protein